MVSCCDVGGGVVAIVVMWRVCGGDCCDIGGGMVVRWQFRM